MFLLGADDLVARDNMRLQIVASVGAVFAVGAGELVWATLVVSAHMRCEVHLPREGTGAEGTLVMEIWEERWHDNLVVIAAVLLFAEGLIFKRVGPGGVIPRPRRIELVKLVTGKWGDVEEGLEKDL